MSEERRETCQRGCVGVPVDAKGRVARHAWTGGNGWGWVGSICSRSGHPSTEELSRRKANRAEKRAALVAEVLPIVPVALDAHLEGRPDFADRVPDCRRAALYEYNRRNKTRHRSPVRFQEGTPEGPVFQCRFCGAPLSIGDDPGLPRYVERRHADHLTECALLYLAGMLDPEAAR